MAGYCDNHCVHYVLGQCTHPTWPRFKLFLKEDGKRCGGFKGTPGINDRATYEKIAKEKREKKKEEKKQKLIEQQEHALAILEEEGVSKKEGFETFFELSKMQQYYVHETILKRRKDTDVMKEIYQMENRPLPKSNVYHRVTTWNNNPNIVKSVKEFINIIADRTKNEIDLAMHDMVDKLKQAIAEVDVETSLPEDIIKMTKDLADIKSKLQDKQGNIHVGNITFTFGDGSTLKDIYNEDDDDMETVIIDAEYDER